MMRCLNNRNIFVPVISNKLEADMLRKMVHCVGTFIEKGDVMISFQYLHDLIMVPRFDITVMLLSKQEKQGKYSVPIKGSMFLKRNQKGKNFPFLSSMILQKTYIFISALWQWT